MTTQSNPAIKAVDPLAGRYLAKSERSGAPQPGGFVPARFFGEREAYASRCGYSNQYAANLAMLASGSGGGFPGWPDGLGMREAFAWLNIAQGPMRWSLEERLDWIEPLNDAARQVLAEEYARLGTFREELAIARAA